MKGIELSKKKKMIMGFENINECNEFLHNLNIHYKNGKIEKESCEYLRDLGERKIRDLYLENIISGAIVYGKMFSDHVYDDFGDCLWVYEKNGCENKYASRTRRKIKEKGIDKTLVDMVNDKKESKAFRKLENMGLLRFSMEALVLRNTFLIGSPTADVMLRIASINVS